MLQIWPQFGLGHWGQVGIFFEIVDAGECVFCRLPEETVRHLIRSFREVLEMKGQSFRGLMRKSFRAEFKELGSKPTPLTARW